jgi:hypothetical protein
MKSDNHKNKTSNKKNEVVDQGKERKQHEIRSRFQIDMDRVKIIQMMRRGMTTSQIAEKMKVPINQVRYDYQQAMKRVRKDHVKDVKSLVALKLAEYSELKREAWEAWERSKEDAKIHVEEESENGLGTRNKTMDRSEGQVGDNSFLKTVASCLQAERELLGLNAPKKHNVKSENVNLDFIISNLPEQGPVPNAVELEMKKAIDALPSPSNSRSHRDKDGVYHGELLNSNPLFEYEADEDEEDE